MEIERPITPSCQSFFGSEQQIFSVFPAETNEEQWNKYYKNGHSAIRLGNYSLAQQEMCLALIQAESFDERDWRFAETLDELGLIHFMLGEDSESEKTGLVYKRQGRDELTKKLTHKPYKIFALGYIPLDQELAQRLAWLVSEYLGFENMEAANELLDLISEIKLQQN